MNKIYPEADMNFWIPADFEKSKDPKTKEIVMKIKGIASTADVDSEGEILEPVGFDLSRFLKDGFLNWNHQSKNDASKIIGEPTVAKVTSKGDLYVEGILYSGHPLAESVWNLANTLEKNKSKRRIGFSIEGKAIERDLVNPKRITKATILGLAITPTPVNVSTYMEICKGEQKQDFTEYDFENDILQKSEGKYIFEFSCDGKDFGITKSFDVEEIEKDMTAANTAILVPESLDKKVRNLEPVIKKAILFDLFPINLIKRLI